LFLKTRLSQGLYITCVQGTFFAQPPYVEENNDLIVLAPPDSVFGVFQVLKSSGDASNAPPDSGFYREIIELTRLLINQIMKFDI
jgi:hypothetical protein